MAPLEALLVLPAALFLFACAGINENLSACSSLRQNHEQLNQVERDLAALEAQPPSEKRDQRKAYLEKRRRMYLEDNDRHQSDCRPYGKEHTERLFSP